jgi:hypothetical protein
VDGLGGPSELRDRAGERREVAGVASQCAHELGLQLEHLELLHQQLVIVGPHRKPSTTAHHRAARGGIRADRVLSRAADTVRLSMAPRDHPTIDVVLGEFVAEQRERLSARTFRNYAEVVELLRHSLDGYAHDSLDGDERRRWEKAFESGDEGAFCHLFGPEKIPEHLGEFLGYFMVRKVIAGQELLRASGTVTGKLVTWLAARGYIDRDSADHATGRAQDASRDLPVADRLGGLLHDVAQRAPDIDVDALDDQDWVEDHLAISDVQPGRIWFEGDIGPIAVPRQASDLARPGWSVSVTAARTKDSWHLLEVGFVYP